MGVRSQLSVHLLLEVEQITQHLQHFQPLGS